MECMTYFSEHCVCLMDTFNDDDDQLLGDIELAVPQLNEHKSSKIEENLECAIPSHFQFPFEPYDIQKQFMRELYGCIELGKVGIFESPTGTGKSLSLICGSLKWLRDHHDKQKAKVEYMKKQLNAVTLHDSDWIASHARRKDLEIEYFDICKELGKINKREEKIKDVKKSAGSVSKKRKFAKLEEDFKDLINVTGREKQKSLKFELQTGNQNIEPELSHNNDNLLPEDYDSDNEAKMNDRLTDDDDCQIIRIFYCSRTHSQLAQFVHEITKSTYKDIRVISLGSRQNLCINESVRNLKNANLINDRCIDLNEKKSKSNIGCPYRKMDMMDSFVSHALSEPCDIENLVSFGRQSKCCPYYGSRHAVDIAEIVVLPYNMLLHKPTRDASMVDLRGSVVIIDEAHNLLETINCVHSVEITGAELVRAFSQLTQYEMKYRSRLKPRNVMYIRQILSILSSFITCLGGKTNVPADEQAILTSNVSLMTINNFLFTTKVDYLNMFKIVNYCSSSKISKKLNGFAEQFNIAEVKEEKKSFSTGCVNKGISNFLDKLENITTCHEQQNICDGYASVSDCNNIAKSPMMHVESFFDALTSANEDGRVVINKQQILSISSIKFMLLNPATRFEIILKEARAVILAGGTMQPTSEFKEQLFHSGSIPLDRIVEFSCGHVISADNLLTLTLSDGPAGVSYDFTYQSRNAEILMEDLGRAIINFCCIIPGGIVVFFQSYDYKEYLFTYWQKRGILKSMESKKKLFTEPKKSTNVDAVLNEYTVFINNCRDKHSNCRTGAILFCIVGGKMSEGINFSDNLGRCVIVVGMPYPNINSPELREKMNYLSVHYPPDANGRQAGQNYYESLCMKAVNQSIGRAIRHRNDFAVILLIDKRYSRSSVQTGLPLWIRNNVRVMERFSAAYAAVSRFFKSR